MTQIIAFALLSQKLEEGYHSDFDEHFFSSLHSRIDVINLALLLGSLKTKRL